MIMTVVVVVVVVIRLLSLVLLCLSSQDDIQKEYGELTAERLTILYITRIHSMKYDIPKFVSFNFIKVTGHLVYKSRPLLSFFTFLLKPRSL